MAEGRKRERMEGRKGKRVEWEDLKRKKYFITSTKTVFNHIYHIHHISCTTIHVCKQQLASGTFV